jgi:hypothetical protein
MYHPLDDRPTSEMLRSLRQALKQGPADQVEGWQRFNYYRHATGRIPPQRKPAP